MKYLLVLIACFITSVVFPDDSWYQVHIPDGWKKYDDSHKSSDRNVKQLQISAPESQVMLNVQLWSPRIDNPTWNYLEQMIDNLNIIEGHEFIKVYEVLDSKKRSINGAERTGYTADVKNSAKGGIVDWTWEAYRIDFKSSQVFIILSYQDFYYDKNKSKIWLLLRSFKFPMIEQVAGGDATR